MMFDDENEKSVIEEKRSVYDYVLWGAFYLIMYNIIFVNILHLDVFAMMK